MGHDGESLLGRLEKPRAPVEVILDTDTFNEIDDQYALAFLVKSGDKLRLRGIHAAPFSNQNSSSPGNGMEKSYKEGDKVFAVNATSDMMMKYTNQHFKSLARLPDNTENWLPRVAEPVVCIVGLLQITHITSGDHVVLVGAGYMGLLTLQGLQAESWEKLTVFETNVARRKIAQQYAPPGSVFDPYSVEGGAKIEEIRAGGGAEVIIEFSAATSGFELANRMIKNKAGKLVIGSWHRHEITFNATP
ncbi:MAG: hypothetical protein LBD78_06260 [Spirochaetaceae bacterium]|jgi:threonine dehydrogenase-like Zn-dependent dehydrogenase|nr:hypothetical protein [Spirochaetaceae bacterium]